MTPAASAVNDPTLADLVSRRHPDYARRLPHWNFVESTYNGGRDWFSQNIFSYIKERKSEHNQRVKRAYRFNHTREIVDLLTKYVFKGEIVRKQDAPKELLDFWSKATRAGADINALMRAASLKSSIFGRPGIIIDSSADGGTLTRADQTSSGARVYGYVVKPQNILDMSFDDEGKLNWILLYENLRDDSDFFKAQFIEFDRYRLWTRQGWELFEAPKGRKSDTPKVTKIGEGQHNLGRVPFVFVPEIDSEETYFAPGLIDDVAYLDRAVANYCSNLDAIIQDQTFSQLVIPAQNLLPGSEEHDAVLDMGSKNVVVYDGEGGQGPHYISPDPKQAGVIVAWITKVVTEIYHSVGMAGERTKMDNAAGIDNSSGVAKAYDFDRMNTTLKTKADRLTDAENEIASLVMAWNSVTDYDDRPVSYPSEFDTRSLYDEFEMAERFSLLMVPKELRQHQMMTLVDKLYPQMKTAERSKIESAIKKWGDPADLLPIPAPGAPAPARPGAKPAPAAKDNKQGQNNTD